MSHIRIPSKQRGAALGVGLLLLLVITLLAISGMNSATLQFVMAGNEQYRTNAFQAAEAGIADTIMSGTFNPSALPASRTNINLGGSSDMVSTTLAPQLSGAPQPAIWGNKWDSFATYHFLLTISGKSAARNSQTENKQAIAVLAPWDASILPGGGLPAGFCATPPCP